jgi:2-methylcitrate dehydratase PrpD
MGRFVAGLTLESLPPAVLEKARVCLINGYGIALGSANTPFYPKAGSAAVAADGIQPDGATLLLDGRRTSVAGAAIANGSLFHGRAQEDTCGTSHFGPNLIPLLTGLIESGQGDTADLIPALVAGYEIGGALEAAYSATTTPRGLRASPLYGSVAAAAAVARLWRLEADICATAIATAASFAGGILQSFEDGSEEWRYQVGIAGVLGLRAAALARAGAMASSQAIEGRSGLVRAMAGVECDPNAVVGRLGEAWSIHRVTFKPYPVCALNQTPVAVALRLREQFGGSINRIESIRVLMNPICVGYAGMDSVGPYASLSETLMSAQFCVATTLAHGTPTVAHMTNYTDAAVLDLVSRIKLVADDSQGLLACRMEVDVSDSSMQLLEEWPADHNSYNFDRAEVETLIRRIGRETGIDNTAFDRLEAFVDGLPGGDIGELIGIFPVAHPK